MKLTRLFNDFFESEKAGGLVLLFVTILSLVLANSAWQSAYLNIWQTNIGGHSVTHWINDGLMTIFFLLIGLELEREIYQGELAELKNATLPIVGAMGGMLVPAGLFLLFNYGTVTQAGAGIPMATDIAFAIGILSLLGSRVPASLKVFLTALAVIDDLGAIIVIAIFYTSTVSFWYLTVAIAIFAGLLILNRLKVHNAVPYLVGGIAMWYCMLHSGVHATITGVLLAFAIPFGKGDDKTLSSILQHWLHKPVAFFILPLFALANTAIVIGDNWHSNFSEPYSLGIILGLVAGKPMGILLFCFFAVVTGIGKLPEGISWKHIFGAGLLAGIGFTMSIFITLLAFNDAVIINNAKLMIVVASVIAGIAGFIYLHFILNKKNAEDAAPAAANE